MILVIVERLTGSYFVNRGGLVTRLVEESETHVVVRLLLLLLLGGLGGSLSLSGATGSGSTSGSGTTATTRGNGSKLLRSRGDELVDVLALKLGDQLVETVAVGLNTNRLKNSLLLSDGVYKQI